MRSRRRFLGAVAGLAAGASLRSYAATDPHAELLGTVTQGARVQSGRIAIETPRLADNGHSVPFKVRVDSPMTEVDHVRAMHVFTEKNPQPDVVSVRLGPRAGRARLATRIRLADTQTVTAICELSDGSFWSGSATVVVTLAACLEELAP